MSPYISAALSVISFIAQNRDTLKQIVVSIENLIPDAAGNSKAAAVRDFIGKALDMEAQMEQLWPLVLPFFNLFVADVKTALKATQPQPNPQ
jgi:hypothetical protein